MSGNDAIRGQLDGLLLALVAAEPAHGYELIERLRDQSGGRFDLPEGTIYPALHRLERTGLIASSEQVVSGRRRRVYSATRRGTASLRERRADWALFSSAITAILGAPA